MAWRMRDSLCLGFECCLKWLKEAWETASQIIGGENDCG